jgi:flagella basal body P-ring formation protein FlgA
MKQIVVALMVGLNVWWLSAAVAESPSTSSSTIRVQGRSEAVVTEAAIRLGDVAQIDSPNVQDDEAVIQLKKIAVGTSPKAGEAVMLEGTKILERLQDQGVRLSSLRYSLPRQVTVTRAFREVKLDELERTLAAFISKSDRQIEVKQIVMDQPIRVPTDSYGLEVVALRTTQPGHIGVDYKSVAGSDEVRFQLRAVADEWRLIPVAVRPLTKGTVVSANDIQLQKVNGTSVGRDVVENIGDLVGRSVTKDVGQGEMFRASVVVLPPVIAAGSRVTVIFRQNRLEASASGVALENGAVGQEIQVRNEQSKRVITGRVSEPGLVIVGAQ